MHHSSPKLAFRMARTPTLALLLIVILATVNLFFIFGIYMLEIHQGDFASAPINLQFERDNDSEEMMLTTNSLKYADYFHDNPHNDHEDPQSQGEAEDINGKELITKFQTLVTLTKDLINDNCRLVEVLNASDYSDMMISWCNYVINEKLPQWEEKARVVVGKEVKGSMLLKHGDANLAKRELIEEVYRLQQFVASREERLEMDEMPLFSPGERLRVIQVIKNSRMVMASLESFETSAKFPLAMHLTLKEFERSMESYQDHLRTTVTNASSKDILWCGGNLTVGIPPEIKNNITWPQKQKSGQTIIVPALAHYHEIVKSDLVRKVIPPSINFPFASQLPHLVSDPTAFMTSVFAKFILRPKPNTTKEFEAMYALHGIDRNARVRLSRGEPVVGMHIRVGKKYIAACLQPVAKYMWHAEEYFARWDLRLQRQARRRIFVVCAETSLIDDIRLNYPHYEVLASESLEMDQFFLDILFLGELDLLISTYSSNVGLSTRSFRPTNGWVGSRESISLDVEWYLQGMHPLPSYVAIDNHNGSRSSHGLAFKKGDIITAVMVFTGSHDYFCPTVIPEGLSVGKSTSTRMEGFYPSYKVRKIPFHQ